MKNFVTLTIVFLLINFTESFSQDSTWFKDVTIQAGLKGLKTSYVQSADINGDNFPDILVGTSGIVAGHSNTFYLYLNVPDPDHPGQRKFVDFTKESGINVNRDPNKPSREFDMAILGDIDNDGDLDLITSIYYHRLEYTNPEAQDKSEVYLNDGKGHFTLKADAGLYDHVFFDGLYPGMIDAVGLSLIDYDYDGKLDLYIATKFEDYLHDVKFPDKLMKGNGDGSFTEVTNAGVQDVVEPLYGVNVTDYDNDGWQDVITSPYCRSGGRILRNMGDGSFIDWQDMVGYNAQRYGGDFYQDDNGNWVQQPLCQWEAPIADFDNDGDMDILQCQVHGGFETRDGIREGHTHIAINQGPPNYNFVDDLDIIHRNEALSTHLGDYGGLWVDFENNGWQDVVVCEGYYTPTSDRAYMCIQKDDHQFYDISKDLGLLYLKDASDAQLSDYDLDGDNDIFIFHNGPELVLLRNDIANKNNWISVKLIPPPGANQSAIGARITVYSDTIAQIREIQTGLGHFGSQEPFIKNFGLGKMNRVDSIYVRWPMKGVPFTKIYNPPTNINIVIDSMGYEQYLNIWNSKKSVVKFNYTHTDFGKLDVGNSKDTIFSIVNVGDTTMLVTDYKIENDPESVYSIINKSVPFTLEPGDSKEISVRFAPKQRNLYNSLVTFNSNAVNDSTKSFDLKGYGFREEPMISVSSDSLWYDSTKTNTAKTVTISNSGELALEINNFIFGNDLNHVYNFTFVDPNIQGFPVVLQPNGSLEININFTPKQRVNYSSNLIIKSNAYNDSSKVVKLFGIGDAPTALTTYDKVFVNFKATQTNTYTEVVVNVNDYGDGTLKIDSIKVAGNDDNIYTFPGLTLPVEVPAGNSKDITIRFSPKEQINYNRLAFVYSNSFNEPAKQLNLRATGTQPGAVEERFVTNELISVSVSPVPVTDIFKITITPQKSSIVSIDAALYNLNGEKNKVIFSNINLTDSRTFEVSSSDLSGGAYFIVFTAGEGTLTIPIIK